MPGSRLRGGLPVSYPSPPLSETNSGSTADCSDGQTFGSRFRRGANIGSNNSMLRRMRSLGGGAHTNHNRASASASGVNNHRQQQLHHHHQQQQQQISVGTDSTSLAVTGNNHSTGFGASPGTESVESMETGGPGTGGSKWGDMSFISLFGRSAVSDGKSQVATGTPVPTAVVPTAAGELAGAAPAVAAAGSNVRNGAVDLKEDRVKPSTSGTEPLAVGSKMRRSESLPAESAAAASITGFKRRGPANFWARNAAAPVLYIEPSRGGKGVVASSVLPPEEPPPPPPPPLVGSEKATRLVKRKQQQQNGDKREAAYEEEGVGAEVPGLITIESGQSSSLGGLGSSGSVTGKIAPAQEGLGLGRTGSMGRDDRKRPGREAVGGDDVESLRRKVLALWRNNKRLSKRVSRRDKMVSDLKKKVQFYRERLVLYEAPLPEDAVADRRAKAREWQRSSARSRSRSRGGGMNDSEFEGSESGQSRSPLSSRLDDFSRFSRTETGSTLASTPGSQHSQPSRAHTPAHSLSASISGSRSFMEVSAAERRGGEGDLVPPPLGRIRLPNFGLAVSPPSSLGPSAAAAADLSVDATTPAAATGSGSNGLPRTGMRGKLGFPPMTPGTETDERIARQKEDRAARAAAAAAARSAWVYEGEPKVSKGLDMAAADREGGSRSQGLLYGGGGRSMESIVSGGQWPVTPNLLGVLGGEAGLSSLVLERERASQMTPSTPVQQQPQQQQTAKGRGGNGSWSVDGTRVSEAWKANTGRPTAVVEEANVANDHHERDGSAGGCSLSDTGSSSAQVPSVDHKKLFRPNLIVEFGEDSPSFRRKVDVLDRNVEGLRGHLQQLVTVARKYCGSGFAFCEHGRELAGILMNMRGDSWFTRLGALAPALVSLGEVLEDIQVYEEETLLQSLENTFCAPMEDFVKREIKSIRKMKQDMNRASEDHEHAMARFLQLKRNSEEGITQARAAEVAMAKKRFEMARFDLVQHLNQLETRKKHEVVDRTCSALYAFLKLFHQCHALVATSEPHMRDLQQALKLSREELEREDQMWTVKRSHLETSLNEGIPASAVLRGVVPPTPSPVVNNTLPTTYSSSAPMPTFSNTWGGTSNSNTGGGGAGSSSVPPPHPPSASRSSPEALARSAQSAAVATAFFLAGPSPSPIGVPSGAGTAAGAGTPAGQSSVNTPLRLAQKHAASLASRLTSGVSSSGGGGSVGAGGGGGDARAETPVSSGGGLLSQANTSAGEAGVTCSVGVGVSGGGGGGVGWGVSKGSNVAVSTGGDTESSYCPSPLPSIPASAGKLAGIWRMGGGGWTSDEDEEEEDGEEGSGGGGGEEGERPGGRLSGGGVAVANNDKADEAGAGSSQERLWSPRQERVIKGGYLWKRSTNVRKDWKRRYFFIQNGKLFYQRQEAFVSPPVRVCDIKLCHVKSCLKDNDLRFSFEIISPKQRTYLLQAEDEDKHRSWVSVIKAEIEHLLSASQPLTEELPLQASADGGRQGQEGSQYALPQEFPLNKAQYNKLMQANPECVDCRGKDPDWASISLGVMMCIECSGIHRSMGVHVSKVRSLTLDRWTAPLLELLEKGGNDRANKVWEAYKSDPLFTKIAPDCDRSSREIFIRAKYERRRFLDPPFDSSPEATLHASRRLSVAAREGDLLNALWCLAHGAIVNWSSLEDQGCTAAQEASRRSHVALLELLVNNGWSLDPPSRERPERTLTAPQAPCNAPPPPSNARANKSSRDSAMLSLLLSKLPTTEQRQPPQGGVTGEGGRGSTDSGGGSNGSSSGGGTRVGAPQNTSAGAAAAATAAAKVALAFQQQQHRR